MKGVKTVKKANKIIIFSFCLVAFLMIFTYAHANMLPDAISNQKDTAFIIQQQNKEGTQESSFNLPTSLITIEESAFEGTALTTVKLPEQVKTIEDNAFANIPTLKTIFIPKATSYIGKDTFKGSNRITITSAPKSYARVWARDNEIPFSPIISFYAYIPPLPVAVTYTSKAERPELMLEGETIYNQRANQTGRMTRELNAEQFETFTAFHIQGRAPPLV